MKLGIIELDHHTECLNSLCQLLQLGDHNISVFTTQHIYDELKHYDYSRAVNWKICTDNISRFIRGNKTEFENQDLLFFSTVESHFKTYNKLCLNVPRLIRVHNANTFLAKSSTWYSKITPYWLFKDLSYFVRKVVLENEIAERKRFVKESNFICFTSQEVTDFVLRSDAFLYKEKIVDPVPITFNEFEPKKISKASTFAVIGTIDRKRKDYNLLLSSLKKLIPSLSTAIELKIMGRPKGQFGLDIVSKFQAIENEHFRIKHWPNGVPQAEFDNEMFDVDVILAPLKKETKYFLNKEIYGSTKISGSINDSIKYARVGVIPEFYPVDEKLKGLFRTFKNEDDLIEIIQSLCTGTASAEILPSLLKPFKTQSLSERINKQLKELLD